MKQNGYPYQKAIDALPEELKERDDVQYCIKCTLAAELAPADHPQCKTKLINCPPCRCLKNGVFKIEPVEIWDICPLVAR